MRATAVSLNEAADRLGVSTSALRRVIGDTTGPEVELLGLELPPRMHPVAVAAWWDAPNAALYLDGNELTPRGWIAGDLNPDQVIAAARHEDA